jgi:3-keto-L-gulonate-6-phosphate decarboxylase
MKQQEFKKEIKQKLNETNEKIQELKNISNNELVSNKKLQDALQELESIKGNILIYYHTVSDLKTKDEVKMPELEKRVYKSFDSFEIAYSNSISLMKQKKFSTRKRSVDFNNPLGNK